MTCALASLASLVDALEIPIRPYAQAIRVLNRETARIRRVEVSDIERRYILHPSDAILREYRLAGGKRYSRITN